MRDYSGHADARRAFSDELTAFHFKRLKRAEERAQVEQAQKQERQALEELHGNAKSASSHGRNPAHPSVVGGFDPDAIKKAIWRANATPGYNDGFFKKMQLKGEARQAGDYLLGALQTFDGEYERLEAEHRARMDALGQAEADAEKAIKDAAAAFAGQTAELVEQIGAPAQPLDAETWQVEEWEDAGGWAKLADGHHWIGDEKLSVPYLARITSQNLFAYSSCKPENRRELVSEILLRAVRSVKPGRLRLLLIDPTSLGNVFAPILGLAEHSEAMITTKVWSTEADIRARLEEESERVGLIIQKYLTDEYETLDEYNEAAGEVAEECVLIAINDFPHGLDQRSIDIVKSLAEVGPRCGTALVLLQGEKLPREQWPVCEEIARTAHRVGSLQVADYFQSWNSYRGEWTKYQPALNDDLRTRVGSFLDIFDYAGQSVKWREESCDWISPGGHRGWHAGRPEWNAAVAEKVLDSASRGFDEGSRVEVRLDRVWQLFAEGRRGDPATRLSERDTLWRESSLERLEVPVGRQGSHGVSTFTFDSQLQSSALLVGRPGSGKSNLLHVIICTLAAMYSPQELELYLLDFKESVEFAGYATGALPHARAIALESDREFGLAVLRHICEEIERRGGLFREDGGEQSNLITYRQRGERKLPRVLLVIDEFHRLFDREDALANESAKCLDDIVRLGRGFGVHCLLASQTLLGMSGLGRHTLNQIAIRAALQCSEEDARVVFGDENPAAALLTRPGEAVKNSAGGRLVNNELFQVPLLADVERRDLLQMLRDHAKAQDVPLRTRVYRRDVQAPWCAPSRAPDGTLPSLRFGDAVAIDPELMHPLTREGGRNVLVVGRNEQIIGDMLAAMLGDLHLRHPEAVDLTVVDLMAVDGPVAVAADAVGATVVRRRDFAERMFELAREIEAAEPSRSASGRTRVLLVNGIGKVRDLDPEDFSDEGRQLLEAIATIVRDGPEVGLFTVVWADSVATIDRRLGRMEREFGVRIAFRMSADDSMRLCDSDQGSELREREALLIDLDRGAAVKFQPSAAPELAGSLSQAEDVENVAQG